MLIAGNRSLFNLKTFVLGVGAVFLMQAPNEAAARSKVQAGGNCTCSCDAGAGVGIKLNVSVKAFSCNGANGDSCSYTAPNGTTKNGKLQDCATKANYIFNDAAAVNSTVGVSGATAGAPTKPGLTGTAGVASGSFQAAPSGKPSSAGPAIGSGLTPVAKGQ